LVGLAARLTWSTHEYFYAVSIFEETIQRLRGAFGKKGTDTLSIINISLNCQASNQNGGCILGNLEASKDTVQTDRGDPGRAHLAY